MNWDILDYIAALVIIGGAIASVWTASKLIRRRSLRLTAMIGLPVIFAIIWVELAVGIFH